MKEEDREIIYIDSSSDDDTEETLSVIDATPLRMIKPIFPPQESRTLNTSSPICPTPLQAFTTPMSSNVASSSSGLVKRGRGRPKGSKNKETINKRPKIGKTPDNRMVVYFSDFERGITRSQFENGDDALVRKILMRFNAARRRMTQKAIEKCSDKTVSTFNNNNIRTNTIKRIGNVRGINIGDIFYRWGELWLIGLHNSTMAGIDYIADLLSPVTTSVVTSGHYDDDIEDCNVLIYTGQGQPKMGKDGQPVNQELRRGNRAMEVSFRRGNAIRVIRGMDFVYDHNGKKEKIYMYDGLYEITDLNVDVGNFGGNEFKFTMNRLPNQAPAYEIWKSIEKWRNGLERRPNLIVGDLTLGVETIPVSLVNEVDDRSCVGEFTYVTCVEYSRYFEQMVTQHIRGCLCQRQSCSTNELDCSCVQRNGGHVPYLSGILLVSRKPMIYECGGFCSCFTRASASAIVTSDVVHAPAQAFASASAPAPAPTRAVVPAPAPTHVHAPANANAHANDPAPGNAHAPDNAHVLALATAFASAFASARAPASSSTPAEAAANVKAFATAFASAAASAPAPAHVPALAHAPPHARAPHALAHARAPAHAHVPGPAPALARAPAPADAPHAPAPALAPPFASGSRSYECGNRVVQMGLKLRLEVFMTQNRGWGLRSWDPIQAGTFICEYAGEVVTEYDEADDYVFDTSRIYQSFEWNYEPELVGEVASQRVSEVFDLPLPLKISAKRIGNVGRFMNHGCSPNVLWQPVTRVDRRGRNFVHIAFFALKHIPPLQELTFDYGVSRDGRTIKNCLCDSSPCRGFFG